MISLRNFTKNDAKEFQQVDGSTMKRYWITVLD